jgi:hypothetical protein
LAIQKTREPALDRVTRFAVAKARRRARFIGCGVNDKRSDEKHGGGKQQTFGHG